MGQRESWNESRPVLPHPCQGSAHRVACGVSQERLEALAVMVSGTGQCWYRWMQQGNYSCCSSGAIWARLSCLKPLQGLPWWVQWLGLWASTATGPGSIPGQGTKIPQAMCPNQKKAPSGLVVLIIIIPRWGAEAQGGQGAHQGSQTPLLTGWSTEEGLSSLWTIICRQFMSHILRGGSCCGRYVVQEEERSPCHPEPIFWSLMLLPHLISMHQPLGSKLSLWSWLSQREKPVIWTILSSISYQ